MVERSVPDGARGLFQHVMPDAPVLPSWLTDPLRGQFAALLPERPTVDIRCRRLSK
ncbi:hypothetical protein [Streptomyces sp. FH025]|uniref:hypothetical protein n=1 Tax=Streptomyces sp. FH025 TaxID=2815937 RepID=UPI001A9F74C3|nr:hypothetical protein [Streptomyces sp. FH025]MBO1414059.1 hypothetical protein [Streptomyces sp. FH025]